MLAFVEILIMFVQLVFGSLLFVAALRIALPMSTTRFSNVICQFIYKSTNPVIGPLTRIIPAYRKLSLATVLVAWIIVIAEIAMIALLVGIVPNPLQLLADGFVAMVYMLLWMMFWLVLVFALMSFFSPSYDNPAVEVVYGLADPIMRPFNKLPPRSLPFSLAPLYAGFAIRVAMLLVGKLAGPLALLAIPRI